MADPRRVPPPPTWSSEPQDGTSARSNLAKPAWLATLVGGLAVVVGSFMPWITLGPLSKAGTSGDGVITVVLGALVAIIALVALTKPPLPRRLAMPAMFLALISAVVAIIDSADVSNNGGGASIGSGLILCLIGSLVATAGAIVGVLTSRH